MKIVVVSYRNSTSNHNHVDTVRVDYIVVSYRNSTSNHNSCLCISEETAVVSYRNSTSNHNNGEVIKDSNGVVSYRNSTSNHNTSLVSLRIKGLYLIEILHQTTTCPRISSRCKCCILSKFYIKPQLCVLSCSP